MSRFTIVLAEQPFRLVFAELVNALSWGLRELGHDVRATTFPLDDGSTHLILAPHLLMASQEGENWRPPHGTIVYNYEPVCSPLFRRSLRMLCAPGVIPWDYALSSTEALQSLGCKNAVHVPFAYAPVLSTLPPMAKDIHVVFIGSRSERRERMLTRLKSTGLECAFAFGLFGPARDALLARARVLLNVHFWPDAPNEDLRILFAAANGLCVSSEGPPDEPRKEHWAIWSSFDELAERTAELASNANLWNAQADIGQRAVLSAPRIDTVLSLALAASRVA